MLDYRGARGGWPFANPINCAFTLNKRSPQANGLVAWWPLGAGQYGMVRDVLGRWHMTAYNSPQLVGSEQGLVTLFDDASSEYMRLTPAVVTAEPFTMMGWFNSDTATKSQMLVCVSQDVASFDGYWLEICGHVAGDTIRAAAYDHPDLSYAETTSGYSVNTWHHACAVYATTTDRRAFLDGGSKGVSAGLRTPTNISNTTIGNVYYNGAPDAGWYFSGMLRDVRIYNRALSDAEVLATYLNPWELYSPVLPLPYGYLSAAALSIPLLMSLLRRRRVV